MGQGRAERPQKYSSVRRESIGTRTTVRVPILSLLTDDYFRGRSARPCPAGPGRPVGCIRFPGSARVLPPPLPIPWPSSLGRVVP